MGSRERVTDTTYVAHVEHFKAELSREVAAMTQDVGRLHQERQAIEQQIADLFAFYSKQKQEAEVCPTHPEYECQDLGIL